MQASHWIPDEGRRQAERRLGEQAQPAPPDWLVQYGLNRTDVDAVHTGHCRAAAKSGRCHSATRQQAIDGPAPQVPPCIRCRPDTALGILD
ncbi:DUF6233 domain-containing protein [Streptomyces caniscabiei]|uniref:DUF6233 domain-containing protein n=1 Tax=Streptomyces caniscabiei TaxID=2746961 RepID=UPI000765F714|nr:DUF6233 domain-containing protein [Streptomyces caniscabiei]